MQHEPTRREKRESKIICAAERGNFEAEIPTYGSEAASLVKDGLKVVRHGEKKNVSLPSTVSWKEAFRKGIPPIVSDYISGQIVTIPKVSNWAQQLYMIAARANNQKAGRKNNE